MNVYRGLGLALALVVASAVSVGAAESINLGGAVFDSATGLPLEGATVSVRDSAGLIETVSTDRAGRFHVIGLTAGYVSVASEQKGRDGANATCDVPSGRTAFVAFRLQRAPTEIAHVRPPAADVVCRLEPETSDLYVIR